MVNTFKSEKRTRNINLKGEKIKVVYERTKEGLLINGKLYPVQYECNKIICRNGSTGYSHFQIYNGVRIPENDKKILEMIFNKKDKQ